ncbi:MAG: DUF2214 domain-containing protein [Reyranella sp.]|nr:DUF2214 domain-containing protein [Reyranella sp.]
MPLVDWLGAWPGAVLLRDSGTAYLFVNAAHILGVGLLVGAILPLDLCLLGLFRAVPLAVIAPFLSRVAATGAGLAIVTGLWLFSVKPAEYVGNTAFLCKAALLATALANVALQHGNHRFAAAVAGGVLPPTVRLAAAASILLWLSVLVAGRWIGFV